MKILSSTLRKIQRRVSIHSVLWSMAQKGMVCACHCHGLRHSTQVTTVTWSPNLRLQHWSIERQGMKVYRADHIETKSLRWILSKNAGHTEQGYLVTSSHTLRKSGMLRSVCVLGWCFCKPLKDRDYQQTFRNSARGTEHTPKSTLNELIQPSLDLGFQGCRTIRQSVSAV